MQRLRFLDQPLRLGKVAGRLIDPHLLAGSRFGTQVLAQALGIATDQLVGRIEDIAEAAVVLLQLDDALDPVFALEIGHIANACAAKGIDALVVIADRHHALSFARRSEHLQPGILQLVGVLELVDQQMLEALLVMFAQPRVVAHHLIAAQHQLGKIDHAFALALRFIGPVDLDQHPRLFVARLDVLGPLRLFLGAGNEPADLLGHETLFVKLHRADHALDGRDRIA